MDELRERYLQVTSEILRLKSDCNAHFYILGARLSEVNRGALFTCDGFTDFKSYLERKIDLSRDQAYKWMGVADNFSESLAAQFGVEKCYAFLRYIEATPEEDRPADILRMVLRVPAKDGSVTAKPVAECSVRDVEAATALVRSSGASAAEWPAETKAAFEALRAALDGLARVGIAMRTEGAAFTFAGISQTSLCDFARRVAAAAGCEE